MRQLYERGRAALLLASLASCAVEVDGGPADPELEGELEIEGHQEPFQTAAAGDHDHGDMTKAALGFLKSSVADRIASGNEGADSSSSTKLFSKNHFDNCRFADAFSMMQGLYVQTVEAFNPATAVPFDAMAAFGVITHAAQDFYAHSNWVETGQSVIFSRDEFRLPRGRAGDVMHGNVVLAAGVANASTLARTSGSRVPTILVNGVRKKGLMSGTYADNVDTSICPGSVSIPHGQFLAPDLFGPFDSFMAKDWPRSPNHDPALALARTQTREELCRLDRLITIRFGLRGQALFRSAWISDLPTFLSVCPNNKRLVAGLITSASALL